MFRKFQRRYKEINYNDFNSKIIKNLSLKDKHTLFYYSLFDPSGWEVETRKELGLEIFSKSYRAMFSI